MMRVKLLKTGNYLIAALMALLGFSVSCENSTRVEYGTPSAKFILKGKITSSETDIPIENIRIIMQSDTAYSDADGNYQVVDKWGFPSDQTYLVQFQDFDGIANGTFAALDTLVEYKDPVFTDGDGKWYEGETSKEFNVRMKSGK
ncbi:MAG TPA: radical SAM-associated putative lipoprotein [Bacteroidales bacterium]|nr:radical SAM-associated putative lipoprotein [Bacteroidales bacterium]